MKQNLFKYSFWATICQIAVAFLAVESLKDLMSTFQRPYLHFKHSSHTYFQEDLIAAANSCESNLETIVVYKSFFLIQSVWS